MSEIIFESKNLYLREVSMSDVDDKLIMDKDPEFRKFLNPPKPGRENSIRGVNLIQDYYIKKPGYGSWSLIDRESGNWIGWFSLRFIDENSTDVEIGCALLKEYRGKGYATEISKVVLEYAFKDLGLDKVTAMIHPENNKAQSILENLGMRFIELKEHKGRSKHYYVLDSNMENSNNSEL